MHLFSVPYQRVERITSARLALGLIVARDVANTYFANAIKVGNEQVGSKEAVHVYNVEDFHETSILRTDSSLIVAAMTNNVEIMKLLLDNGWRYDHRSASGLTALQAASKNVCYEAVKFLLERGARVLDDEYVVPKAYSDPQRADMVAGLLMTHGCAKVVRK